jgi:hypothetical protein
MANLDPGLCSTCKHSRVLSSARGSSFYLCELHGVDPRFPKYPRLPVRACSGWLAQLPAASTPESGEDPGSHEA